MVVLHYVGVVSHLVVVKHLFMVALQYFVVSSHRFVVVLRHFVVVSCLFVAIVSLLMVNFVSLCGCLINSTTDNVNKCVLIVKR